MQENGLGNILLPEFSQTASGKTTFLMRLEFKGV
jgi:hypothetical protein